MMMMMTMMKMIMMMMMMTSRSNIQQLEVIAFVRNLRTLSGTLASAINLL